MVTICREWESEKKRYLITFTITYSDYDKCPTIQVRVFDRKVGSVLLEDYIPPPPKRLDFVLKTLEKPLPYGYFKIVTFDPVPPDWNNLGVWSDFYYGHQDLAHFEGVMVGFKVGMVPDCKPVPPPTPCPEKDPHIDNDEGFIENIEGTDVFPYLYMKSWEGLTRDVPAGRFIRYDDLFVEPKSLTFAGKCSPGFMKFKQDGLNATYSLIEPDFLRPFVLSGTGASTSVTFDGNISSGTFTFQGGTSKGSMQYERITSAGPITYLGKECRGTVLCNGVVASAPVQFGAGVKSGEIDFHNTQSSHHAPAETSITTFSIEKVPLSATDAKFYSSLVSLRKNNKRKPMIEEATDFVLGKGEYARQFISCYSSLQECVGNFWLLYDKLHMLHCLEEKEVVKNAEEVLGLSWTEIRLYLLSQKYQTCILQVWQNVFALNVLLHYRQHLLDTGLKTLSIGKLLTTLATGKLIPSCVDISLEQVLDATVILPETIFPLPPFEKHLPENNTNRVKPYAIGDLQMLRQRLMGYEPGEVSHIENVLRGERKEVSSRQLQWNRETYEDTVNSEAETSTDITGSARDLYKYIQSAIGSSTITYTYADLQTTYGAPVLAPTKGDCTVSKSPGKLPSQKDSSEFARDVVTRAVSRMKKEAIRFQSRTHHDESEERTVHTFDNSHGKENIRGVYRWLNKVYKAYVVNYGNRFLLEFILEKPAKFYLVEEMALQGENDKRPIPPGMSPFVQPAEKLNNYLFTFRDVTRKNFAQLGAQYKVRVLPAPPDCTRTISVVFQSTGNVTVREVLIPDGYMAAKAVITTNVPEDGGGSDRSGSLAPASIGCIVGSQQIKLPNTGSGTVTLSNVEGSLPVGVSFFGISESHELPQDISNDIYAVTVTVECLPNASLTTEWQMQVYSAIMEGYEKLANDYFQRNSGIAVDPLEVSRTINFEIKKGCMGILLQKRLELVGLAGAEEGTGQPPVNEQRFQQFYEEAFEWDEMNYGFYQKIALKLPNGASSPITFSTSGQTLNGKNLLTAFQQADHARVILPVRPAYSMQVLFYLASGMIWNGPPLLTPTFAKVAWITNRLKIADETSRRRECIDDSWEVRVPTGMKVLQESTALFSDRKQCGKE